MVSGLTRDTLDRNQDIEWVPVLLGKCEVAEIVLTKPTLSQCFFSCILNDQRPVEGNRVIFGGRWQVVRVAQIALIGASAEHFDASGVELIKRQHSPH